MKVLLDTHTLVWTGHSPEKLGANALEIIGDPRNTILVSAVSAWEIATKVRIGKFPEAISLEADFVSIIVAAGYTLYPISAEDALRAGRMHGTHRDPFDRMLAAQALSADIPVISRDKDLDSFGVRRIW